MGYRSNVVILLTKELDRYLSEDSKIHELFINADERYTDISTKDVLYYFEGIKWYDTVGVITKLTEELHATLWSDFYFLRIGEDYEDIEEFGQRGNDLFEIGFKREITFNRPKRG